MRVFLMRSILLSFAVGIVLFATTTVFTLITLLHVFESAVEINIF